MKKAIFIILLILAGSVLYIPFTGKVSLFDWDEVNFAEAAREMLITKNYTTVQIDYEPFWEKPPLFIWLQTASMHFFGINEFAARFPNALCGIFTLVILFLIGSYLYNETFGFLWAMAYLVSVLPFLYFKSGIIDPWFNLFIFLGLWFLFLWWNRKGAEKGLWKLVCSAFFTGLAILTKGPVALLVTGLVAFIYLLYTRFRMPFLKWQHLLSYVVVISITGGLWFILLLIQRKPEVIVDFFLYQYRLFSTHDAGHRGFLLYHFVVLLVGVFPASVYALRAFARNKLDKLPQKEFKRWMMILFWVVLILFTLVKTKIVHYSSLCYFPLTYLCAWTLYYYLHGHIRIRWYFHLLIAMIAVIYLSAAYALPHLDEVKKYIVQSGLIKDDFAIGCLQASGNWNKKDYVPFYLLAGGLLIYAFFARIHHRPLALLTLALTSLSFTCSAIILYTPKIENYVQHAAIEFYRTKQGKDCYVQTAGFKSYAHLFYTSKPPVTNPLSRNIDWLLKGEIDKPVFIVMKNYHKKEYLQQYHELYLLYEKNGFVFCSRRPQEGTKASK